MYPFISSNSSPPTLQDCIWAGRCVQRGWFLPYAPGEREFGAWKNHYVSCVSTLDWLTPREAAERYGTLNQQRTGLTEEEEERKKERRIRQTIREKLQEDKSEWKSWCCLRNILSAWSNRCTKVLSVAENTAYSPTLSLLFIPSVTSVYVSSSFAGTSMRTRRAWGSYTKPGEARGRCTQTGTPTSGITFSSWPSLSWPPRTVGSPSLCFSLDQGQSLTAAQSLERVQASRPIRSLSTHSVSFNDISYPC